MIPAVASTLKNAVLTFSPIENPGLLRHSKPLTKDTPPKPITFASKILFHFNPSLYLSKVSFHQPAFMKPKDKNIIFTWRPSGMVRIQSRISRKRYLHSKQTYKYERISLHIPRKFHNKVKPFLKQDLHINPCIIVQYGVCVISPSSIIHPFLRSSCCTFGMSNAYFTCSQFSALHSSQNTLLPLK